MHPNPRRLQARAGACARAALLLSAGAAAASPASIGSEAVDAELARGVELNLTGDWDAADRHFAAIRERYPRHPGGWSFGATTYFWRTDLDPADRSFDEQKVAMLDKTVALAEAWLEHEPESLAARYYLGRGLGFQSRLAAEAGEYYRAGNLGERARKHHEAVLAADPRFADAKASLGPYLFFADLLPGALRWLRWLWFVPTGDRERGLALLDEARKHGRINALGAEYAWFRLLGRYEPGRRAEALETGRALTRRFPLNAVLRVELVRLLVESGESEEAHAEAEAVIALTQAGTPSFVPQAATAARIWSARADLVAGRLDEAVVALDAIPDAEIEALGWAPAWIALTRGQIHDARGERARAVAAYERVEAFDGGQRDPHARLLAGVYLDAPYVVGTPSPARRP